jgi:hypothetical protein
MKNFFILASLVMAAATISCSEEDVTPTKDLANTTWVDATTDEGLIYTLEFWDEGLTCSMSVKYADSDNFTVGANYTVSVSGSAIALHELGSNTVVLEGTYNKTTINLTNKASGKQLAFQKQ